MGCCFCKNKNEEQEYDKENIRNYISVEINIEEKDINKDIRIINSNEKIIIEEYFFKESNYENEEIKRKLYKQN